MSNINQDDKELEQDSSTALLDGKPNTEDSSSTANEDGKEQKEDSKLLSPLERAMEIADSHSSKTDEEEEVEEETTETEDEKAARLDGERQELSLTEEQKAAKVLKEKEALTKTGKEVKEPTPAEKAAQEKLELTFQSSKRFQELNGKVKEYEPIVQQFQQQKTWQQQNGITDAELGEAHAFVQALKRDPAAAHKMLMPLVEKLNEYVGEKLPVELQADVDAGKLTVEYAKELARTRSNAGNSQRQLQLTTEQQTAKARQDGLDAWVNSKKGSDMEFEKKFPLVNSQFLLLWAQKPQATPQEVVAFAEQAYTQVQEQLKPLTPRPPERRLPQRNSATRTIDEQPKTPFERAMQIASRHK